MASKITRVDALNKVQIILIELENLKPHTRTKGELVAHMNSIASRLNALANALKVD